MNQIKSWVDRLFQAGFGNNRTPSCNGCHFNTLGDPSFLALEVFSKGGGYTRVAARSRLRGKWKDKPFEFVQYQSANPDYPKTEFFAGQCTVSYLTEDDVNKALEALCALQVNTIPPPSG